MVINHIGTNLDSGHYYKYIRSSDNHWYAIDDAVCRRITEKEVFCNPEALMLFCAEEIDVSTNARTSAKQQNPQIKTSTPTNKHVSYSSILVQQV